MFFAHLLLFAKQNDVFGLMILRNLVVLFCVILGTQSVFSQEKWTHDEQFWVGYMTQSRLHDHWSLWNDTHWVPQSFFLLRTGITRHIENPNITTTLGFARLWIYPAQQDLRTFRPEYRPWGQTTFTHQTGKNSFTHRLRYDARMRRKLANDELMPGYDFNWRLRYMINWRYNLPSQNEFWKDSYLVLSNEILYNVGGVTVNGLRMDQNRASVMLGKNLGSLTLQLGYMNFISQANRDDLFFMKNTFVFWIFHRLDFRKPQDEVASPDLLNLMMQE